MIPSTPVARCLRTPISKPSSPRPTCGPWPTTSPCASGTASGRSRPATRGSRHRARLPDRRRTAHLRELRFRHRDRYLTPEALGAVRPTAPKPEPATVAAKPRPKPPKPRRDRPWRKHFRARVALAIAKRETPRRPLRDRSRPVQVLVLSLPAGTAAPTPVPAGVGRDRRVGIRAPGACRRCAGRSAHHSRPSWQAQCELRAIRAAAPGPLPAGLHPAWPRRPTRLGLAATGLEAPGAVC